MGWIEGLNASVDYIEEHLDGDVDIARAASFASCTEGQFRRMFSYLAEMGLAEYVRKRRLSCAALDLSRGERVLDVAVRYGYSSPTAFNRAFQEAFGVSPSEARRPGAPPSRFPAVHVRPYRYGCGALVVEGCVPAGNAPRGNSGILRWRSGQSASSNVLFRQRGLEQSLGERFARWGYRATDRADGWVGASRNSRRQRVQGRWPKLSDSRCIVS